LITAAEPWITYAIHNYAEAAGDANRDQVTAIMQQVQPVFDILKVFRQYVSSTYLEDGALVTHGETVVQDLAKE
jgi:hypothetical protein